MNKLLKLLCAIILIQTSCSTDVDLIAPYKEIPVVYGLLNTADSIQYIRINRAFLGEGNAYVMAQSPDSFNYPDILDVKIERIKGSSVLQSINLSRDTVTLDPGIFATQNNIVYVTSHDSIYQDSEYKLTITNKQTGAVITSQTPVVDKITVDYPPSFGTINFGDYSFPFTAKWYPATDGRIYDLTIRFYYNEWPALDPTQNTLKFADWHFAEVESTNPTTPLTIAINCEDFYRFVKSNVDEDNTLRRAFNKLDFVFTVGADVLYTYSLVNQPPSGIAQSIPDYTNINGGIGVFSSRFTQTIAGKQLDTQSSDSLKHGIYTGNLGFQ